MSIISIIGAGPIGCFAGFLLAKKGHKVSIFEDHAIIGEPVQCAGIVSRNLLDFFDIDELKREKIIINEVKGAHIIAPDGKTLTIKTKKVQAFILDRFRFDNFIADKARKAGAKIFLLHRYVDFKEGQVIINDKKTKNIIHLDTDYLIGADGPLSDVAKTNGMYKKRKSLIGLQYVVESERLIEKDIVEVDLGASKEFFGWIIPESKKTYRIGIGSRTNTRLLLKEYLNKIKASSSKRTDIIKTQGGIIPIYGHQKIRKGNVYLVGDAACMIKNTTGGGIIVGLSGAKRLAESLGKGFSLGKLGLDLWLARIIRDNLDRLTPEEKNRLVKILKKKKNKRLIESIGDMDFPSRFLFRLIISEPRLITFFRL